MGNSLIEDYIILRAELLALQLRQTLIGENNDYKINLIKKKISEIKNKIEIKDDENDRF